MRCFIFSTHYNSFATAAGGVYTKFPGEALSWEARNHAEIEVVRLFPNEVILNEDEAIIMSIVIQ
jgi:hypothetical protein